MTTNQVINPAIKQNSNEAVTSTTEKVTIQITRRPWYEWLLWALWVVLEIFLLQNAVASAQELEPRAATVFWASFFVLLIGGAIVWFVRRPK